MNQGCILVVDDEPDIRGLVQDILTDEGYTVVGAENGAAARHAVREHRPDLILLDIWMPDEDGISLLREWLESGAIDCPVIMMSGHATVETAIEATRLGAHDVLEKPISMAKLLITVERALESVRLTRETAGVRRAAETVPVELVGKSASMELLREQIKRLAQHDARVLLVGEAGSGKETAARYLHAHSSRRSGPFLEVAAGTISPAASAIEFFGSENNGKIRRGLLEQAHGGTLFLEDVSDLEPETQVRLLGTLETGAFYRVGGTEPIHTDFRLVASTHVPLDDAVRAGLFRRELFYLLNAVTLKIPPLREHSEDVPELLRFYVDYFVSREKLPFRRFPVSVQNFLRHYAWNGNIRELKNLVQRLLILGSGEDVSLDEVKSILGGTTDTLRAEGKSDFFELPLKEARERFEKTYLEYHLDKYGGSVARLSQAIGLERTHLYRKLNALGIKFKDKR
jgi:DNA-binding NtrC family response regulator